MANFCRKCITKVMGIKPDNPYYEAWLTEGLCEGCGRKYGKKEVR